MIYYKHFVLDNGLRVYVHEDHSVPVAVLNILYDVGSRDENENKTGFAHLFEHLMFGGSKHIGAFDEPLQKVGGENNAFTSSDITNYYITIPSNNLETAFWLESDRMLSLSFDPEVLEVQRKVVIEEFKQRYLNQPYGDVWLKLNPTVYKVHPYRWTTIGKDISHIEKATLDDVREFFYTYYLPNNAIMVVAGDVTEEQVKALCKKWFEPIPAGKVPVRNLPKEPRQAEARLVELEAEVPADAIYKAYHTCSKLSDKYHTTDLLSDVIGRGKSSRLYQQLVKEKRMFSSLNAYVSGTIDEGMLVITGKLNPGVDMQEADREITAITEQLRNEIVSETELEKVKNQAEATRVFAEMELLNRAMNLAYSALLGDVELINTEAAKIQAVTPQGLLEVAHDVLRPENCSTMYYRAKR